jgi:tetratricopeptide (TPR) repeat protein
MLRRFDGGRGQNIKAEQNIDRVRSEAGGGSRLSNANESVWRRQFYDSNRVDEIRLQAPSCIVRVTDKPGDGASINGTGFFVDCRGHVATCWHVVSRAQEIWVRPPYTIPWKCKLLTHSEQDDLAILELVVPPSVPTECLLLHSNWRAGTNIGDTVVAWGYSAATNYTAPQRFECKISAFSERYGQIGLNGDINRGDSGSPLLNVHGQVVGIVNLRDIDRRGQAMAVPVSALVTLIEKGGIAAQGKPPSEAPVIVPSVTDNFVGREAERDRVLALLERCAIVTLTGIGGIGKSELAKNVAHVASVQDWAADGVRYFDLQGTTSADSVIGALVIAMRLESGSQMDVLARQLSGRRLYVLDDISQALISDRKGIRELIRALHDYAQPARFLITSRELIGLPGVESFLRMDGLLPPSDVILFHRIADDCGYKWEPGDEGRLEKLLAELEGYPLALTLAGNLLGASSLTAVLNQWRNRRTAVLKVPGVGLDELDRLTSVDFSLALSLDSISSVKARTLFAFLASLPAGITEDAIDKLNVEHEDMDILVHRSLVKFQDGRFTMLSPVREFAARSKNRDSDLLVHRMGNFLLQLAEHWCNADSNWLRNRGEAVRVMTVELPNLHGAMNRASASGDHDHLARLTNSIRCFYEFAMPGVEALQRLRDGAVAAAAAGLLDIEANCTQSLGEVYQILAEDQKARSCYQEAIEKFRELHDPIREACCGLALADLDRMSREFDRARFGYEQARAVFVEYGYKRGEANCIKGLGDVHLNADESEKARRLYDEALPLYRCIGDAANEANCVQRLGDVHLMMQNYDLARDCYSKALPIYEMIGSRLGQANCIQSMGDVHRMRRQYAEAREQYQCALSLYQALRLTLGEANCIQSLGDVHRMVGEYDPAAGNFERALSLYEKMDLKLGRANCIQRMGNVSYMLGDYDNATQRFLEALQLYHSVGSKRGEANCVENLGLISLDRREFSQARLHFQNALVQYDSVNSIFGRVSCLRGLGLSLLSLGEYVDARDRLGEALAIYTQLENIWGRASCLENLGHIQRMTGNYAQARESLLSSIELFVALNDSLGEANCVKGLGDLELLTGNCEMAKDRLTWALELYRREEAGRGVANTLQSLGQVSLALGDIESAERDIQDSSKLYLEMNDAFSDANCTKLLGDLAVARGDFSEASKRYRTALEVQETAGNHQGVAEILETMGELEERQGNREQAANLYRRATGIFESIGLGHMARHVRPSSASEDTFSA